MPTITELQQGKFVGGGGQDSCYYCNPNNAHGYYFDPGGYYSSSYFNGSYSGQGSFYSDSSYYSPYSFGSSYSDSSAYWLRTSLYSAYEANAQTLNYTLLGAAAWEALKALGLTLSAKAVLAVGGASILLQGDSSPDYIKEYKRQPNNSDPYKTGTEQPWREPGQINHVGIPPNWGGAGQFLLWVLAGSVTLKYCSDNTKVKIPYRLDYNVSDSTYIK